MAIVRAAGGKLLRKGSDGAGVAIALLTAGMMILGATGVLPLWSLALLLVLLRWDGIIQHNHTHLSVFQRPLPNRVFDVVLTFVSAVPQRMYRYIHVEVHHRFLNGPQDWTGPFSHAGSSFPDTPMPFWRYCVTFTPRGWMRSVPPLWSNPRDRRALLGCSVPVVVLVAVLVVNSPMDTALFVLLPWVATAFFLPFSNWLQHEGCSYESPSTSANVNMGLLSRAVGFNIGYHSVHHLRPAAHWSRLPDLHARLLAASVPSARVRTSPFLDLLRAHLGLPPGRPSTLDHESVDSGSSPAPPAEGRCPGMAAVR